MRLPGCHYSMYRQSKDRSRTNTCAQKYHIYCKILASNFFQQKSRILYHSICCEVYFKPHHFFFFPFLPPFPFAPFFPFPPAASSSSPRAALARFFPSGVFSYQCWKKFQEKNALFIKQVTHMSSEIYYRYCKVCILLNNLPYSWTSI